MNDKIKELISKSYDYATITTIDPITSEVVIDFIDQTRPIFNQKKFAELIVRECMSQIEEVKNIKAGNAGPVYTQGFDDGMFVAIRTIEEHFGVEE